MKAKPFRDITIRRTREHEIHQAIKDLEARGFVLKYGPERVFGQSKTFDKDDYNRSIFRENISYSTYVARMGVGE